MIKTLSDIRFNRKNTILNLVAPVNGLGYGIFTLGVIKELELIDRDFRICPIGDIDWPEIEHYCHDMEINIEKVKSSIVTLDAIETLKLQGPTVTMWHGKELDIVKKTSDINRFTHPIIGFTQFEIDYFDPILAKRLKDNLTAMATSSLWATKILRNLKEKPTIIDAVAGPVTTDLLKNRPQPVLELKNFFKNKVIAISSGKWEDRKDQATLLEVYSSIDNPETIIFGFWHNIFTGGNKEPIEYLTKFGFKLSEQIEITLNNEIKVSIWKNDKGGTIALFPRINRWIDLMRLYTTGDFIISISKGEGWDLPVLECLGMGIPHAMTSNTAHEMYSFYTTYDCTQKLAYDGRWFFGEGNWYPIHNPKDLILDLGCPSKHSLLKLHKMKLKNDSEYLMSEIGFI